MPDYMKEERLQSSDVYGTTADQLLICLCVDSSYSMYNNGRIKHVNDSIREFINKIKSDPYALDTVDLCIITFGGNQPEIIQAFSHVDKIDFKDIVPNGGTPLGKGVSVALDEIRKEKNKWSIVGVSLYKPWLIIMSDDGADDDTSNVAKEVQKLLKNRKLKTKCLGLGNGNENGDLSKFSLDGIVEPYSALEIDSFFDYLSRSASGLSLCSTDDDSGYFD